MLPASSHALTLTIQSTWKFHGDQAHRPRHGHCTSRPAQCCLIRAGGFTTGGFNFDAKVRRQSIDAEDLFHGHIGGIDTVAHGLLRAAAIIEDGQLDEFRRQRYAGWQSDLGRKLVAPDTTLAAAADLALAGNLMPQPRSGRQEWCENLINRL